MVFTFSQADLINQARDDFLRWCASEDFPEAHVDVAWAFIDHVTRDRDLRVCQGIVSECVQRAKQQLLGASGNQRLGVGLTTAALTSNLETLMAVVFDNKATLLAAARDASESAGGLATPTSATNAPNHETDRSEFGQVTPTSSERSNRHLNKRQKAYLDAEAVRLDISRLSSAAAVLRQLMSGPCGEYAEPFWYPVDPVADEAPDYLEIIQHPMDLETIKEKYNSRRYSRASEVKSDIELMLNNCFTYNPEDSQVYVLGRKWEVEFRKKWGQYVDQPSIVERYSY